MKTFKQHLIENKGLKSLLNYDDSKFDLLKNWLNELKLVGKSPSGMKDTFKDLQFLLKQVELADQYGLGKVGNHNIKATLDRWTIKDIDLINSKLKKKESEPIVIKIDNITFSNKSGLSFKNFKSNSEYIAKELKSLKGIHKKSTSGDLKISFVMKDQCSVKAKYKSELDELYIRADRMEKGAGYASLIYVILHELGHRYERKYKTYTVPYTTKYSRTDSFAGNEAFAELFAISNWKKDYPQYKEQIDNFLKLVK